VGENDGWYAGECCASHRAQMDMSLVPLICSRDGQVVSIDAFPLVGRDLDTRVRTSSVL
jgi:hypothetical protein